MIIECFLFLFGNLKVAFSLLTISIYSSQSISAIVNISEINKITDINKRYCSFLKAIFKTQIRRIQTRIRRTWQTRRIQRIQRIWRIWRIQRIRRIA